MARVVGSNGTRVCLGGSGKALDFLIYRGAIVPIAVVQPLGLVGLARRGRLGHRPLEERT
jgi:hypothetical protein